MTEQFPVGVEVCMKGVNLDWMIGIVSEPPGIAASYKQPREGMIYVSWARREVFHKRGRSVCKMVGGGFYDAHLFRRYSVVDALAALVESDAGS